MAFDLKNKELTPLQRAASTLGLAECRDLLSSIIGFIDVKCKESDATLMHFAALNRTHGRELVKYFASEGLKVDAKDKHGREPIHYALGAGNSSVAAKIHALRFPRGANNLLHFCVLQNNLDWVKAVLEYDESMLHASGSCNMRAIHFAASVASLRLFEFLLEKGADASGFTLFYKVGTLHFAGRNLTHGKDIINFLLSRGMVQVDALDRHGTLAISYALQHENIAAAEELLEHGATLSDQNLITLMHRCIKWNKLNSAKFLLALSQQIINRVDALGSGNALHVAAKHADLEFCKWLIITCGFDPRTGGHNIIYIATANSKHGSILIRYFVQTFLLDYEKKRNGLTPLQWAFKRNNIDAAQELVLLGAYANLNVKAKNCLHYCVRANNLELAKIVHGQCRTMMYELGSSGKNMLHYAARYASLEMCKWLVEDLKFNVHAQSERWRFNVLHYAAENKAHGKKLVRYFASLEVDLNRANLFKVTPLGHAKRVKNYAVAHELRLMLRKPTTD